MGLAWERDGPDLTGPGSFPREPRPPGGQGGYGADTTLGLPAVAQLGVTPVT